MSSTLNHFRGSPQHIGPLDRVADLPGRRALRSAGTSCLVVPSFRHSTVGSRTFNVSVPRNTVIHYLKTLFLRRHWRRLETFLFQQSYLDIYLTVHLAPQWSLKWYMLLRRKLGHSNKNYCTELNWTNSYLSHINFGLLVIISVFAQTRRYTQWHTRGHD